jgi:16S rRNA (guanine527-N7)-methyltransferase
MITQLNLEDIFLQAPQIAKLDSFMSILIDWNKKIRLTGYRSLKEIRTNLILDSVLAYYAMDYSPNNEPHIDFGSGNGVPGIVFSVLNPERKYLLLEKIEKKRVFMEYVIRHLGLNNVEVLSGFSSSISSPVVWMKAITISDFLGDSKANQWVLPPVRFFRFGVDPHPSCKHISTYVINGVVKNWDESHSLTLSEAVFQG